MSRSEFVSDLTGRLIPDSFNHGVSDSNLQEVQYDFTNSYETEEASSEIFQESIDSVFSSYDAIGKDGSTQEQNASTNSGVASGVNELDITGRDSLSLLQDIEGGFGNDQGDSNIQQTQEVAEGEAVGAFEGFQDLITSSTFSNFAGLGLSMLNTGFMDYLSTNQTAQTMANQTPGHIHLAPQLTAAQQSSTMRLTSTISNLEIGVGSFFGPEGLLVGAIAGAATDAIGNAISQNEVATINSTSGNMVPDIQ